MNCSVFLVFEYCAHDLGRLLDTMPRRFYESETKCLLKQVRYIYVVVAYLIHSAKSALSLYLVRCSSCGSTDQCFPRHVDPWGVILPLSLQLLEVMNYLHNHWIIHRDLKLSNLLLTSDGILKLCDYGLARYFKAYEEAYTPKVVTLWYR